jgi:dCMP deaminase
MKDKHIRIRIEQCLALSKSSSCVRRKFGALLLDPERNVVLADGYNGPPRGGPTLCGVDSCLRANIESGTQIQVGCHHAEMNVICNAAANGIPTKGSHLIVTGEPCLMCAKLIHHAGIVKVYVVEGGYLGGQDGVEYLINNKIEVELVDGPKDPRFSI